MALIAMSGIAQARDGREPVRLPAHMQNHMLANMRDHLVTLNAITGDVADGKFDDAAKLAERRPGMSSLGLRAAAHAGVGDRHASRRKPACHSHYRIR